MSGCVSLKKVLELVTTEIIRGLLENMPKGWLYYNQIGKFFKDEIGPGRFQMFEMIFFSECPIKQDWGTIVKSSDVKCKRQGLSLRKRRSREATSENIIGNLSIEAYKLKILFQIIIILLDGDMKDVNQKGTNGNTLLHLVASLPTESEVARKFQVLLVTKLNIADYSLKNDQKMTPLHMIAGNYLLDPNNGFALSHERGLATECNTNGRLQKLSILTSLIQEPFLERGRHCNSILHEWVIYCSEQIKMSTIEKQIGDWIIKSAKVPTFLSNDYGCTALHYAFTDDLVKTLCQHKSAQDTGLLNADGDTPFLHIFKHGLLRRLANIDSETDFEGILAAEMNINFNSDPNNDKTIFTTYEKILDSLTLATFEANGFDVAAYDRKNRNCLDNLLLFIIAFSSRCKELQKFSEVLKYIIENWIQSLLKSGGVFDNPTARENTLSTLIFAFFEVGSSDQLISTAEMLLASIKELFIQGADPSMITCPENNPVFLYCCTNAIEENGLHLELVKILCENGASTNTSDLGDLSRILSDSRRQDISKIIENTKPKLRVTLDIQSVRYKDQLDSLSRKVQPQRVEDCRYDPNFIGQGAISFVYLSINDSTKREQALKEINKKHSQKEFKAEIQALKGLEQYQNVINFYNLEETKDFYYLAIELMDGDLTALVKEKHHHLADTAIMQQLAADIVRGMEFLHSKGMIHRDIKPENILYREKPQLTLKLADFGLSKNLNSCDQSTVRSTKSTSLCGTRGWMAPELIRRTQPSPTKETDMFALGLVLHFLFSKGYHPFHSVTISLVQDLSAGKLRPHKIESNISKKKMQIKSLNKEQRHLVVLLLDDDPASRPISSGLLKNQCYFWSSIKKVTFIWKIGDQPEVAKPTSTPMSTFGINLQSSQLGQQVSTKAWSTLISVDLFNELSSRKQYDTSSILSLIRFFRNAYVHYEERSPGSQVEILNDQIFEKIPEFFVTVWMEVLSQGWTEEGCGRDMLLRVINAKEEN